MTITAGEDLTSDVFYVADDPDEPPEDPQDPGQPAEAAADEPPPDDPERAPFGWTRDRGSKAWRPKLRAGRPRAPAGQEELRAAAPPEQPPRDDPPREDRKPPPPPAAPASSAATGTDGAVPMPAKGLIARKIDKTYRRAGRFIAMRDPDIGAAFIMAGTKEDPDDVTAGEAWEELCRVNPRVRAFVMRFVTGGTYWDLVMAHAPIFLAILMKESVLKYIPFRALLERWAEPEETAAPEDLRPEDAGEMMDLAEEQARRMARGLGITVDEKVLAAARAQAERQHSAQTAAQNGGAEPSSAAAPDGNRQQRRAQQSRARRKAGHR